MRFRHRFPSVRFPEPTFLASLPRKSSLGLVERLAACQSVQRDSKHFPRPRAKASRRKVLACEACRKCHVTSSMPSPAISLEDLQQLQLLARSHLTTAPCCSRSNTIPCPSQYRAAATQGEKSDPWIRFSVPLKHTRTLQIKLCEHA
nr:hypothetical protein CFP56_50421 [Quercus suber]